MADNNIVIKITSEAQLTDAQLQLRELTDLSKEYELQMKDLKKAEEEDLKAMKERIAAGKEDASIIQDVLETYRQKRQEIQKTITANKGNIEALNKEVKAYKQVEAGGKKLAMQLRDMREQMMRMEEAGEEGSRAYQDLAVAAAKLQDQIGDTSQRIRYLASDTKELDAAMSIGSGLGGVFNMATSAAALFGGEMEELEKAFYKVQSVMSIINGLQEVAIVLNKDSAASVVINNALERIRAKLKKKTAVAEAESATAAVVETAAVEAQTTATGAATTAQMAFNASMLANPVTWIVAGIAALIAGIVALVSWYKKAAREARGYGDAIAELDKKIKHHEDATALEARKAEARGESWRKVMDIEIKALEKDAAEYKAQYEEMLLNKRDLSEEELEQMEEMHTKWREKREELTRKREDVIVRTIQEETDTEREARERAAQAAERRREEIASAKADLEDLRITLMKDGQDKDIAQENLDFQRRLKEIKGNSQAELELRSLLEEQHQRKINEIVDKYIRERAQKKREEAENEERIREKEAQDERDHLEEIRSTREKYGLISDEEQLAFELAELDAAYKNELITYEEYQKARTMINGEYIKKRQEQEEEARQKELQHIQETFQLVADTMTQAAEQMFEALNISVQKQLDALDKYYTTDADEAARNADKKYMTEEQYEKKKAELTLKQQKLNKASTLFQIGIQTATAIMNAMATAPWPLSVVQAALAGTMGAAQLAIAASKPLPQYAKGRKGGPGEYALVGEKGPELMYVPEGASIVPNNKLAQPGAWGAFGVPEIPNTDSLNYAALAGLALDYDKLGKAISANISHEQVIVNVDKGGVAVTRGRSTRTYLNTKYAGQWN